MPTCVATKVCVLERDRDSEGKRDRQRESEREFVEETILEFSLLNLLKRSKKHVKLQSITIHIVKITKFLWVHFWNCYLKNYFNLCFKDTIFANQLFQSLSIVVIRQALSVDSPILRLLVKKERKKERDGNSENVY